MTEIIARGLIVKNGRFLVCSRKGSGYRFLPGGHIDPGENGKEALIREFEEERGSKIKILNFIGVIENSFEQNGKKVSEINLIFEAEEMEEVGEEISKEDHLEFKFITINEFDKENVLPLIIKDGIIQWLREKKPFYFCQSE